MPTMSTRGSMEGNPAYFPPNFNSLAAKCKTEIEMYHGTAGTDVYSEPIFVGNTTGFSIYVNGTGTVTLEVSPNPGENMWCTIGTDGTFTVNNAGSAKSFLGPYGWARVKITSGGAVEVWMYKKYFIN